MKATETRTIEVVVLGVVMAFATATATAAEYLLPGLKTENGITYMSGGIGQAEANAMRKEAKHYPLSMVFSANKDNEYLADVHVTIKDKAGNEVLSTISEGPVILLKLPPGRYSIEAEVEGKALHRTVQVQANDERQIAFHWPSI
jgi:hypothetical protein